MSTKTAKSAQDKAVFPPFKRVRTGRKGCTKYVQLETGSWVTFTPEGECHVGCWHRPIGELPYIGSKIEQSKQYAEGFMIHMKSAERERDEAIRHLRACVEDHARSSYTTPVWDSALAFLLHSAPAGTPPSTQ